MRKSLDKEVGQKDKINNVVNINRNEDIHITVRTQGKAH